MGSLSAECTFLALKMIINITSIAGMLRRTIFRCVLNITVVVPN
jgi:hypothetical protein